MLTSPVWTLWLGLSGSLLTGFSLHLWARQLRSPSRARTLPGLAAQVAGSVFLAIAISFMMLIAIRELKGV